MPRNHLHTNNAAIRSQDVLPGAPRWPHSYGELKVCLQRFLTVVEFPVKISSMSNGLFTKLTLPEIRLVVIDLKGLLHWRLYRRSRNFFTRFFTLAGNPALCASTLIDYWLLLQSTWSKRESGPDVVYPLLSTTKRQSGRLAKLILEHSRDESSHELFSPGAFSQAIKPPCVAVIDLSDDPHHRYSTPFDSHDHQCIYYFLQMVVTLVLCVIYLPGWGWGVIIYVWTNPISGATLLSSCWSSELEDGASITLTHLSDSSTPGSAVLLDSDLAVVLNGNQNVVEAIIESGFTLADPTRNFSHRSEYHPRRISANVTTIAEALWTGVWVFVSVSSMLLFYPGPGPWGILTDCLCMAPSLYLHRRRLWNTLGRMPAILRFYSLAGTGIFIHVLHALATERPELSSGFLLGQILASIIFYLNSIVSDRSREDNYPIQTTRFLDALGNPQVRKWQFGTVAAAAAFQCLVICRGISRPVMTIDVPAFLDMLVPDQRPVWKAWKSRVAHHIVYEEADIDLTPMVPTFPDERQKQLKDLLDQAQFAYDTYKRAFN